MSSQGNSNSADRRPVRTLSIFAAIGAAIFIVVALWVHMGLQVWHKIHHIA